MASKLLQIAKAKVDRAETQIDNLEREVRKFISTNSYDITSNLNFDKTEQIWRFRLRNKDTVHLSVLAGEIGHNLRTSLDNLMCEIADQHAGRRDRTYFLFGKTLDIFEIQVRQKTRDLPPDAIELVRGLQPYKGGNDLLWAIHDLNRDDKHPGLDPISNVQGWQLSSIATANGLPLIIGSRWGQHLVCDGYKPKFLAIEAMHEDGEFLTTTPGAEVHFQGQPTFQIAFRDVEGFKLEPVVEVLHQMRDLVESIFLTFERRFFP